MRLLNIRQNDLLAWLLDETYGRPERRTVYGITQRILSVNFAAIHTSSMVRSNAVI
jgi:hypothetical protein